LSVFLSSAGWFALALIPLSPLAQQAVTPDATTPQATPTPTATPAATDPQGDKPIVPDDQFDKALPPLSDDINAPLEPMPTELPAVQATQGTSAAAPATAADSETLTPPETEDPQLAQPLVPLGSFDTTPLQQVANTVDEKSTEIAYDTDLKGLDPIGLEGEFESLSALRDGHGKAANAAMLRARAREDENLAVRLMKAKGYYDGTAISTIDQVPRTPGRLRATVSATPGSLYTLGSVKVDAKPTVPAGLIDQALPLKVGDPIDAAAIEGGEANVALRLPQQGYPFVKVGQRDVLLDDMTHRGDYTLPVDIGPRSSFGGFRSTTALAAADTVADATKVGADKSAKKRRKHRDRNRKPVFSEDHIKLLARFKPGQLYDNRKVDDLRQALVATGLFSTVSVEPVETNQPGPDGMEQVDLLVRQRAGPWRSIAATGGYSTGEGIKLEGSYTDRNLFPPEGALILNATAGTQEQGAGVTFRRSNAGKRDRTFSAGLTGDHSNYDAFDAVTGTLFAKWSYDSTPIWQKTFTYSYGVELTGTNESVYDFNALDRERKTYFIAALPMQAEWDTSDDLLNPTRGYRLKLNLSPETSVRGAVRPYVRTMVEATAYYPVTKSLVIAGRARAGSILGIARDDLAPSRRYYGGGGGSVRGYGYQRLGPFDPNGDPVGGRSLNEFALEARYRFGYYGIVPFIDAGNSYGSSVPKFNDLRFGAGIGGRLYTNFGPIRVDVATPLNRRKGDGKIALYISIGQAF